MAQFLLLVEHALVVLGNLGPVARNLAPVNLTGAAIHRSLIQALVMLDLGCHQLAKHFRAILVSVVELRYQAVLRTLSCRVR